MTYSDEIPFSKLTAESTLFSDIFRLRPARSIQPLLWNSSTIVVFSITSTLAISSVTISNFRNTVELSGDYLSPLDFINLRINEPTPARMSLFHRGYAVHSEFPARMNPDATAEVFAHCMSHSELKFEHSCSTV